MNDDDIAAIFATQTALLATLVEQLIKDGVIDRGELVETLYELLLKHGAERQPDIGAAPIRHLIGIIEPE